MTAISVTPRREPSNKTKTLLALFDECVQKDGPDKDRYVFHNDDVKRHGSVHDFKNPFDATKLDRSSLLPEKIFKAGYAVIHLGKGRHAFFKGVDKVYHPFEKINTEIAWPYQASLLNPANDSESQALSIANNQRILHHFLFEKDKELCDVEIIKRPKTYFPHRTKTNLSYTIGGISVELENVQMEIDLTLEYCGKVGIFEAKKGKPKDFSVYQLYHPFLMYKQIAEKPEFASVKEIVGVYVVATKDRKTKENLYKFWAYTFDDPTEMTSIRLVKSEAYRLVKP